MFPFNAQLCLHFGQLGQRVGGNGMQSLDVGLRHIDKFGIFDSHLIAVTLKILAQWDAVGEDG